MERAASGPTRGAAQVAWVNLIAACAYGAFVVLVGGLFSWLASLAAAPIATVQLCVLIHSAFALAGARGRTMRSEHSVVLLINLAAVGVTAVCGLWSFGQADWDWCC